MGRRKHPVLAEVKGRDAGGSRPGALDRAALDAYAGLASKLDASGPVLVSGSAKSEVALGVAAAATAAGRRVALLECDIAHPTLAGALGLPSAPGLHEYLREEAEASQILQPLVLAGPASGRAIEPLAVIVAGEPQSEPVALIDSDRCDKAIQRLRKAYDLLVIDGPSLGEDPDSLQALAEHSGATLLAGGRGEASRRPPVKVSGLVLVS
ncbi:MAG: tyrosine-protein kinase family protein [Solirubrobacterales bacterium]